ncbi:hypothetical protein M0R72_06460 [Candidatus Pacearchaeota archaeon]|jgi:hypothetical protein|nr:hypothetical protein [Candidatus Pacearchaeota archaeon]
MKKMFQWLASLVMVVLCKAVQIIGKLADRKYVAGCEWGDHTNIYIYGNNFFRLRLASGALHLRASRFGMVVFLSDEFNAWGKTRSEFLCENLERVFDKESVGFKNTSKEILRVEQELIFRLATLVANKKRPHKKQESGGA